MRTEVESLNADKESYQSQIEALEAEIENIQSCSVKEKNELHTELQQAKQDRDEAQKARNEVAGQLSAVAEAKRKGETLQDALKKEAQYIMTDLEEVNAKLTEAEQERDKVTHQKDKVMNELAKRNQDIQQKEEQIKKLEEQVREKDEQMTILDVQVSVSNKIKA